MEPLQYDENYWGSGYTLRAPNLGLIEYDIRVFSTLADSAVFVPAEGRGPLELKDLFRGDIKRAPIPLEGVDTIVNICGDGRLTKDADKRYIQSGKYGVVALIRNGSGDPRFEAELIRMAKEDKVKMIVIQAHLECKWNKIFNDVRNGRTEKNEVTRNIDELLGKDNFFDNPDTLGIAKANARAMRLREALPDVEVVFDLADQLRFSKIGDRRPMIVTSDVRSESAVLVQKAMRIAASSDRHLEKPGLARKIMY